MICKKCGSKFEGKFCPECGTPAPQNIVCKHCGTEYSGNFCPDCGKTNQNFFQRYNKPVESLTPKQKIIYFFYMFGMMCILILLMVYMASNSISSYPSYNSPQSQPNTSYAPKTPTVVETIKIAPADLIATYKDNEIKANELYLSKVLEITGVVNDIGVNVLNEEYITIGKNTDAFIDTVLCKLEKEQSIDPATLEKGVTVTVRGTYAKSLLGVMLYKCTIDRVY